jgi:hypothetical protein
MDIERRISMRVVRRNIYCSEDTAKETLNKLKRIAKEYGTVSLADYYEIREEDSSYIDNRIGWTYFMIKNTDIITDAHGCYHINFPRPITLDTYVGYKPVNTKSTTPEPLCITIHTKELDDVDATLAETFKYIYTIKDRMVNLTIM